MAQQLKFTPIKISVGKERGTKASGDLVEALQANWDHMRKQFNEKEAAEQEEMLEYFNSAIDNLGETLFGADSESGELSDFANALDDKQCDVFVTTVKEGCILD